MKKAYLGAGCFWGVEFKFSELAGVTDTKVGYMGGNVDNPTYPMVCQGTTDHAEVVEVTFDETLVSFDAILGLFWQLHDPTTLNRQGPDVGTQYRSVIFYTDETQKKMAETSILKAQENFKQPIVTQIVKAPTFYLAEEYHQEYLRKKGKTSCSL